MVHGSGKLPGAGSAGDYLERVLLVMDTPDYRVPQFEQSMMTLLYRVMVVSWRSVLAAAVVPVEILVQASSNTDLE